MTENQKKDPPTKQRTRAAKSKTGDAVDQTPAPTKSKTRTTSKRKTTPPVAKKDVQKENPVTNPEPQEEAVQGIVLTDAEAAQYMDNALEKVSTLDNTAIAVVPVFGVKESIKSWQDIIEFIRTSLVRDIDWGVIPGTGDKPALLKAGAERLNRFFGFTTKFEEVRAILDFTGKDHNGEPFFFYEHRCLIYLGDRLVSDSNGSANSWEAKHRYRNANRVCPECGEDAIYRSKFAPRNNSQGTPGWYCFDKRGGCGFNFPYDDPRIKDQVVGKVMNPDPADLANTVLKMSIKRAFVGNTILATGTGGIFTQDVEDYYQPVVAPDDYSPVPSPLIPNAAQAQKKQTGKPVQQDTKAPFEQHATKVSGSSNLPHAIQYILELMDLPADQVSVAATFATDNKIDSKWSDEEIEEAVKKHLGVTN